MTRKRTFLVGGLILLGVALVAVYWRSEIIGYCKHESRYHGKYTNFWRSELTGYERVVIAYGNPVGHTFVFRRPSLFSDLRSRVTGRAVKLPTSTPALLDGDPEALSVLAELLKDDDVEIRGLAIYGLKQIGRPALPYLQTAVNDADSTLQAEARQAMQAIETFPEDVSSP